MLGGAELGPEALDLLLLTLILLLPLCGEQLVVFDLGGEKLLSRLQSWQPNPRAMWAFVISLDANSNILKCSVMFRTLVHERASS